ncbi:pyridoxamine 5'-phosphate oxidase family protein [Sulfitobacter sabulilitoris]|uniref:General stress protein n=1 Tax=Sulfitobacter sabulilitoris TaxID=2562655 RepID=A0A5S3PKQ3_9RHOB|nr:pyridoxamine 5'-phosphate oxidase family protein [Sulfitobacter sabulilitoris]TMM54963.1 general stress protein [Sulfitobacter sabulilitoris]
MSDTLKDTFWSRIDAVRAGMLESNGAPARPMAHYADKDAKALWFITARQTDIANAARAGAPATYVIASTDAQLYGTLRGTLHHVPDQTKLDALWGPMAEAWFDGGKDDPDVFLARMDLAEAELWATDGAAKFLYETAKANLTETTPDVGDHGKVTF